MSEDIKHISVKNFRKLGFVQEINRRLLHPCGLALEVIVDEDGTEHFGEIWDCREDPEGLYYGEDALSRVKAQTVVDIFNSKCLSRRAAFGHIIQPVFEQSELK